MGSSKTARKNKVLQPCDTDQINKAPIIGDEQAIAECPCEWEAKFECFCCNANIAANGDNRRLPYTRRQLLQSKITLLVLDHAHLSPWSRNGSMRRDERR
jgi:hypothetical protein